MSQPSLILGAKLPRSVDAAHPQYGRVHPVNARVVPHVLVGGTLGASVGTIKVQRNIFRDATGETSIYRNMTVSNLLDVAVLHQATVDLVSGCEDHRSRMIMDPDRLQHIQGAAGIDLEIIDRLLQTAGNRNLSGKVQYCSGAAHRLDHRNRVANIAHHDRDQLSMT